MVSTTWMGHRFRTRTDFAACRHGPCFDQDASDGDRRATSAPKPSGQPTRATNSPATTRQDHDRARATKPAQPRDTITSAPKACIPAKRAIPAAVKREIWQRDGVRCRYVDPRTGRRCASRHLLQIDHLLPLRPGRGCGAEERAAPLLRSPPPPPWGSGIIAKASQLRCAGRSTCGIVAFQGN